MGIRSEDVEFRVVEGCIGSRPAAWSFDGASLTPFNTLKNSKSI